MKINLFGYTLAEQKEAMPPRCWSASEQRHFVPWATLDRLTHSIGSNQDAADS